MVNDLGSAMGGDGADTRVADDVVAEIRDGGGVAVFVGLAEGWVAGSAPTPEDIADHLATITAAEPHIIPTSIFDEVTQVCTQLGIG